MNELNLEILENYLGKYEKHSGAEYQWQCPYCVDSGKDNLKYNINKNVLYCFANPDHAKEILKNLNKNNNQKLGFTNKSYITTEKPKLSTKEYNTRFEDYMYKCNSNLLLDENLLNLLYRKRGIKKDTVSWVKLGYDKTKKIWTIPTINYSCTDYDVIGFEFRQHDLSKIGLHRTKDTPNGMAMINDYSRDVKYLCVVEGYFDGYALFQHLIELKIDKYYHIVTPSNGVQSLVKYLSDIDYSKYSKYYLYIDNDDVSNKIKLKVFEKYPQFEPVVMNCSCKDFNEHYLKCIKGRN